MVCWLGPPLESLWAPWLGAGSGVSVKTNRYNQEKGQMFVSPCETLPKNYDRTIGYIYGVTFHGGIGGQGCHTPVRTCLNKSEWNLSYCCIIPFVLQDEETWRNQVLTVKSDAPPDAPLHMV